jgi:WD40 repeat protein
VSDIEISHDGQWLAVTSGQPGARGFVDVWRFTANSIASRVWSGTAADVPSDLAFSPDNTRLAVGYQDGVLQILSLGDGSRVSLDSAKTITPHADAILAVAWSADSQRLMTGSRDRTAKIFDASAVELIANYDRHQRAVGGVAYRGDKPVSLDETGQLRLWSGDDSDRTLAEQANLPRFLEHISADDDWVYIPDGGDVRLLRVERKEIADGKDDKGEPKKKTVIKWNESAKLRSSSSAWLLSLSIHQGQVAAGNEAGEVFIWTDRKSDPVHQFLARP